MKNKLIVDGRFISQRLTGVQRTAWEILKCLDNYKDIETIVALPANAEVPNQVFLNVKFIKVGKFKNNMWEQWSLPRFCKREKAPLLCMCCLAPAFYPSNVILHDIRGIEKKEYDNLLFRLKFRLLVRLYIYRSNQIYTVSEYAKDSIVKKYHKLKREPIVIFNGHEHISRFALEPLKNVCGKFYLSVGSILKHKNFEYIIHLAKNNPDKKFIVVGNPCYDDYSGLLRETEVNNLEFTGYIESEQLRWLYSNCEGFILPSIYEGFGLPPLEAIATGCRRIFLSDIPIFKEIYGEYANYFDPFNFQDTINLENGKSLSDLDVENLLKKYTWKDATSKIVNTIFGWSE